MNHNLQQLAVFHAIAVEGGITAAARRLAKSPPAVHHALKQFERRMGRPLFERVGRRLRLTAEGQAFHKEIERALGDIERATRQWASASPHLHPLRIAAVSGFGRFRLYPRLLRLVPAPRPIEITLAAQDEVLSLILRGRANIGVVYKPVTAVQIATMEIAEEELILVAPSDYPRIESARAALGHPFITYDEYEYVFGRWFQEMLGKQPSALNRLDHASELDEALTAVAAGRGITIAPREAWARGPWRGKTRCVSLGGKKCTNALYLASVGDGLKTLDADLVMRAARPAR
jgi:DNA-binding transcriptional LysR family regulator